MQHEKNTENDDQIPNEEIDESPWGDEEKEAKDSRLRSLEDLIRAYKTKTNKTPISRKGAAFFALWLHRWMVDKIQSTEFHEHLEQGILTATYGKKTSRETLSLQRQATEDIATASKLLHQRLGSTLVPGSLGSALEQAYKELEAIAKDHPDSEKYININNFMERFDRPSWAALQDVARTHLLLIEEVARKATINLEDTRAQMGQPKKSDRDRLFYQWQNRIASDLRMSLESSTHLACQSWLIYFEDEKISEEAAAKIIQKQRISSKGK